jgi:hypothetical protein
MLGGSVGPRVGIGVGVGTSDVGGRTAGEVGVGPVPEVQAVNNIKRLEINKVQLRREANLDEPSHLFVPLNF